MLAKKRKYIYTHTFHIAESIAYLRGQLLNTPQGRTLCTDRRVKNLLLLGIVKPLQTLVEIYFWKILSLTLFVLYPAGSSKLSQMLAGYCVSKLMWRAHIEVAI